MAEKQPPRKVQAPRVRAAEKRPKPGDDERRRRLLLYGLAASGLIALAAVIAFFALAGSGEAAVGPALEKAGCTYETREAMEGEHVAEDAEPDWETDPPSSGPHFPVPAPFDFYEEPVDPLRSVHNLEHGGIVVHFGDDVPDAQVEQLRSWWLDEPNAVVVSPLPDLDDEFALTAWTKEGSRETAHLARCGSFDEDAFSTFRDELRAKGPEPFTLDMLEPGE